MAATKQHSELRRPGYASVTVRRDCMEGAKAAMAEVKENTLEFVSTSVAQRTARILSRRDRRIAREQLGKVCHSLPEHSHKVATMATTQSSQQSS